MSDTKQIRKNLNIIREAYEPHVQFPCRVVKILKDDGTDYDGKYYKWYRTMLDISSNKQHPPTQLHTNNIFIFYSQEELDHACKIWDSTGIKYEIVTDTTCQEQPDVQTVSPLPSKNPWWGNSK